jgi:spermidine synthase
MNWVSFLFPQKVTRSHSRYNKTIEVIERFGKKELYVNGIQQSGPYTIRLWKTGLKELIDHPPAEVKTVLVLGIGGGTLFGVLRNIFPAARITGVDIDGEIIRLYRKYFQNELDVRLLCTDAQVFVKNQIRKKQSFDLIIIDLYIGNDVPEFVTQRAFLTSVKNILSPAGLVIFNYFCFKNQTRASELLLDKLSGIYQSVIRKNILRNIFFYCLK